MVKAQVYTSKGIKSSSITLPKEFGADTKNLALLAQAVRIYEWSKHPGTHKTKTRGEVSYSTRKLYRQKHTGRARHGARSAPIYVGGGIAHGPTGIKKELSMPKKMRKKALAQALSLKAQENQIVVASGLEKIKKTKDAQKFLDKVGSGNMTVLFSSSNMPNKLAFRNIENVNVLDYKDLNAHDVYFGGILIIDKGVLEKKKVSKAK